MEPIDNLLNGVKAPWHYPLLKPYKVPSLGLFVWAFWDCSYTAKSLTKLHRFDVFIPNYRKWWQLPICGFQIWGKPDQKAQR